MLWHLAARSQPISLPNAFAHNDYFHKRPLFDALDHGYTHIEADVFLYKGKLVVAHHNPIFKRKRTLESLYLEPLLELSKSPGGFYKDHDKSITLMIDIKTKAERTYKALKPLLDKYKTILTEYKDGKVERRCVTVVLSGNKPNAMIRAEKSRLAFVDADLRQSAGDSTSSGLYAMASCNYHNIINWTGLGRMPWRDKERLRAYVNAAHKQGRKVRLWASPDLKAVWQELLNCGVDLINTDKLAELREFLVIYGTKAYAQGDDFDGSH